MIKRLVFLVCCAATGFGAGVAAVGLWKLVDSLCGYSKPTPAVPMSPEIEKFVHWWWSEDGKETRESWAKGIGEIVAATKEGGSIELELPMPPSEVWIRS